MCTLRWLTALALLSGFSVFGAVAQPTVSGLVLSPGGQPLPGVELELYRLPSIHRSATSTLEGRPRAAILTSSRTDEHGHYRLVVPESGVWGVAARAEGHQARRYEPLVLVGDTVLPPVSLPRSRPVRFQVSDASGTPLAGCRVRAERRAGTLTSGGDNAWQVTPRQTRTDPNGNVTLSRGEGEQLDLLVFVPGSTGRRMAAPVAGLVVLPARAELVRRLELRDSRGEPVSGAVVLEEETGWPLVASDARGRLALAVYAPTRLRILAPDGQSQAVTLDFEEKSTTPSVVTLEPARRLRGRVVERGERRALPGAIVWSTSDFGRYARAGADGFFEILVPSRRRTWLQAEAVGYVPHAARIESGHLASGQGPPLELGRGGSVEGRFVDVDGRALAHVQVELASRRDYGNGNRDRPFLRPDLADTRAESGPRGRFRLKDARPGYAYWLRAHKRGFAPLLLRGVHPAAKGGGKDLGTLTLEAGVNLSGTVTGGEGEALAGVAVHVLHDVRRARPSQEQDLRRRKPAAVSGAGGRFELRELRASEPVALFLHRSGYGSRWVLGVEPRRHGRLSLALEPTASVAGRLVDPTGAAVASATVRLERQRTLPGTAGKLRIEEMGSPVVATTDGEGRFEVAVVPGEILLRASAPDFVPATPLELRIPAAGRRDLEIILEPGAVLDGKVLTEHGEPVEGARVIVGERSVRTDARGGFHLRGVPLGRATVHALHAAYLPLAEDFDVTEADNRLELVFPAGQQVTGHVVDGDGHAVAGAAVRLDASEGAHPFTYRALTDRHGAFVLEPVAAGEYRLAARAAGYAESEADEEIRVRSDPIHDLEIRLLPGSRISGRILGLEPADLARLRVLAEGPSDRLLEGRVEAEGRYVVSDAGPGSWRVTASLGQGVRQARARVRVEPGGSSVRRDLEFADRLSLSGEVLYGGEPLPGTTISLTGETLAVERTVETNFAGEFHIADLEPGSYALAATNRHEYLVHNETLRLDGDRWLALDLQTAHVAGYVIDAGNSRPLSGTWLKLRHLADEEGSREFLVAGKSDGDGSFLLPRVPPGRYRFTAANDGYAMFEDRFEVFAGQAIRGLEVALEPTAGLDLEVRLASGGVPAQVRLLVRDPAGGELLRSTRPVDAIGRVRLATVPPGDWSIFLQAPGTTLARLSATVPGPVASVVMDEGGRVEVLVDELVTSDLVAHAELIGLEGSPLIGLGPYGALIDRWPVVGGEAMIEGVPAGTWTLRVTAPSGRSWSMTASVMSRSGRSFVDLRRQLREDFPKR